MAGKRFSEGDHGPSKPTLADRAWNVLRARFQTLLSGPTPNPERFANAFEERLPREQQQNIEAVLRAYEGTRKSYRIALIIQLAYGITVDERVDLTMRPPGARGPEGVAGKTGKLLADNHIVSVKDAYQNIAKNSRQMARGNFSEFDNFLRWASEPRRTKQELTAAFDYACWRIAETARPVRPMPELDPGKLTFSAVMTLLVEMLAVGSHGAHEQFIVAALLEAKALQANAGERVETQDLNASDQSMRAPADIQIKLGTRVEEAFEVTANEWSEKVDAAHQKIRTHDLSRLHILARVTDYGDMLRQLLARPDDISVLELRGFIAVLLAELRRAGRAVALRRLYELLDRLQRDVALVNAFVERLFQHRLAAHGGTSSAGE